MHMYDQEQRNDVLRKQIEILSDKEKMRELDEKNIFYVLNGFKDL